MKNNMSKHGSGYNEQVIEHLELLLNKEGQILTEDAEDYLRSVVEKAIEAERDRIGGELMRLIQEERNKIPDKFDQPFELAESVGSKMTIDTIKQHITNLTGVEK